jgi:hypothetical protein
VCSSDLVADPQQRGCIRKLLTRRNSGGRSEETGSPVHAIDKGEGHGMPFGVAHRMVNVLARYLQQDHMRRLGIASTMRLAQRRNRFRYHRQNAWRSKLYETHFEELIAENGPLTGTPIELNDGWYIDSSMTLPYLEQVLEDSERIIGERAGAKWSTGPYRSWFQDMWTPELADKYPSFLDFATSSDLLVVLSRYLGTFPVLSTTAPQGIRVVESNSEFDTRPNEPKDSQLFHIDYYAKPSVYVIVLIRDTAIDQGPWHFLPKSVSMRVKQQLGYWRRGKPYRLTDEEVYSVADPAEVIRFACPRGSVLFIESSGCMHYGSRNMIRPRFQLMYGYTGMYRTDFYEDVLKPTEYPPRPTDSRLRRLALDKHCLGFDGTPRVV